MSRILFLFSIIPALFLIFLINNFSVNVPYWDQWAFAPLFEKFHNGYISFSDLIAQHNESRKFFPRLLFIGLAFITKWNVRYEMGIIFLLACIISFNLYHLNKLTVEGNLNKRLLIVVITNLLIFAPIQWENWLWGIQVVVFVPIACITTGIIVAYSSLNIKVKFLISICLSTISTFSYANGILCWVVLFPVLYVKSKHQFSNKKWLVFSWLFTFTINAITYFYNYKKPTHHPSFSEGIIHPINAIHYFFSFLGAPLGLGYLGDISLIIAPLVGFTSVIILLVSCIFSLKYLNNTSLVHSMAGWFSIAIYSLISGIITTLGRVGFGVGQSLSFRYTTFSIYFIISTIYIVIIIYDSWHKKLVMNGSKRINLIKRCIFIPVVIILILHFLTSVQAVNAMSHSQQNRILGKSCLHFINVLPEEKCLTENIFPDLAYLKHYASVINGLGFLTPPLAKNNVINKMSNDNSLNEKNFGWFDNLTRDANNLYVVSGWAVLPNKGKPADSVILTYKSSNQEFKMFKLVTTLNIERHDVAKSLNKNAYLKSGWMESFPATSIPERPAELVAWGFDADTGQYFRLNGGYTIK